MKKLFLLLALFVSLDVCAYEYKPLLTDGKCWKVKKYYYLSPEVGVSYITYTVVGDTLIGKRVCKKIKIENVGESTPDPIMHVAYEDNQKVYEINDSGKETMLFDFNIHKGDVLMEGISVENEDYIVVDGIERRRLTISAASDYDGTTYWVEGIGTNNGWFIGYTEHPISVGLALVECSENGKIIFTADDFKQTNKISNIKYQPVAHDKYYTLDGRTLGSDVKALKSGVYIVNGKKVVR